MVKNSLSDVRRHGIYYTPSHLADFLVKPLLTKSDLSIFDPAYGEGALLLAVEKTINQNNNLAVRDMELYGCDRTPVNGLLSHLPSSHLVEIDFFDYPLENKFDVIVMNPPFVRHHYLSKDMIKGYKKAIADIYKAKSSSDLWVYFLIKSCLHLKKGGKIGAILPWSFLQAEYAQGIRIWLSDNFKEIQVLALSAEYFDGAQERVILLWLKGYGCSSKTIKASFSKHISDVIKYFDLTKNQWQARTVLYSNQGDIQTILDEYINKYGFKRFEEFGNVKIGVVTGADQFFILNDEDVKKYGFTNKFLIPIYNSSKYFSGLYLNGNKPSKKLVILPPRWAEKFKKYIIDGVKARYHLRAHSQQRDPWYYVNQGEVPDAFFPYRVAQIPYIVLNNQNSQCTNSIHRLYFKEKLSQYEQMWLQLSLLSVPGQLSIEAYSRTYGSGVLKIEPNALKKSLVYKTTDKSITLIYNKISKLLTLNQRVEAMKQATDYLNNKLHISNKLSLNALSMLIEIQDRRMRKEEHNSVKNDVRL